MTNNVWVKIPETGTELWTVEVSGKDNLEFWYEELDCRLVDIVDAIELPGYCLIVDDEGLMKDQPQMNNIASLLYGFLQHGQPIVGGAIIGKNLQTENGMETIGMSEQEAEELIKESLR